jgi:hypothetical protein
MEDSEHRDKILITLRDSAKITSVPELAKAMKEQVTPKLLSNLVHLKMAHLVTWKIRKHIYLAPRGFDYLEKFDTEDEAGLG